MIAQDLELLKAAGVKTMVQRMPNARWSNLELERAMPYGLIRAKVHHWRLQISLRCRCNG